MSGEARRGGEGSSSPSKGAARIAPDEFELRAKDAFFEGGLAAHSLADERGVITLVNRAFLDLWGYESKEEAVGRSVADFFVNPEDGARVLAALAERGAWEGDFVARRRDGARFVSHGFATVVRDRDGRVRGYQSTNVDVTERRRDEAELARHRRELELRNRIAEVFLTRDGHEMYFEVLGVLLDAFRSPFGVFGYIDEAGALVVPSMTRHIWQKCEVPDKTIVFPRETWGESLWPTAIRRKEILWSNEPSTCTPEGHIAVTRNISAPIVHGDRVVGLFQVANKETDYDGEDLALARTLADGIAPILAARLELDREQRRRRGAEAALALERDNLDAMLRATPVALLVFDELEDVSFANAAASRLLGRPLGGEGRRRCGELLCCVHREDVPEGCGAGPACAHCALNDAMRGALREGRAIHGEEGEVDLDSGGGPERRWLLVDAVPLVLGGRPHCVMAISDVTARRRAEAARDLLEEQLRSAQRMEAVGRLAGGVAHDFNNLLSAILSFTEFALEATPEGTQIRDDLLQVRRAGRRAERLVGQLLAFSRKQVLQPSLVDLDEVLSGLEKMLRRVLGEDVELVLRPAGDRALVWADTGQLEQIVMNLVVNARDAMPRGGTLTLETSKVDLDDQGAAGRPSVAPGAHVRLTVRDTGHGMDEEVKAHLFEPFFTTKGQGKGTGLGLATVFGIVAQSGGHVAVESQPGCGATFEVLLPRVRGEAAPHARSTQRPVAEAGDETILVVEDEEIVRAVVRRGLEAAGYDVLTAADGEEALARAEAHDGAIHLLLTDVVMPRMGGLELAALLGRRRPGLRVLYMSGYADEILGERGVRDAEVKILPKPFTATELASRVREVLDRPARSSTDER